MAKNIIIRKHKDKIEVRDADGDLIVDVIVANSSRTHSVNLSVQADRKYRINKVPQKNEKKRSREKYTESEQLERRRTEVAIIRDIKL